MQIGISLRSIHGFKLAGDFQFGLDGSYRALRRVVVGWHTFCIEEGQDEVFLFIQIVAEGRDGFLDRKSVV